MTPIERRQKLEGLLAQSERMVERKLTELRMKNGDAHEHGPQRTSDNSMLMASVFGKSARQKELALERIESSNYGICVDCAEAIAAERLEHRPDALRCTPCATLFDRSSRR